MRASLLVVGVGLIANSRLGAGEPGGFKARLSKLPLPLTAYGLLAVVAVVSSAASSTLGPRLLGQLAQLAALLLAAWLTAESCGYGSPHSGQYKVGVALRVLLWSFAALIAISLAFPASWQAGRFALPGVHPGIVSAIAASLLILCYPYARQRRILLAPITLLVAALAFGFGRASFIALAAACLAALGARLVSDSDPTVRTAGFIASALLIAGVAWGALANDWLRSFMLRGQTSEQFASMTGRRDVWSDILSRAGHDPLLGSGYGSFYLDPANPVNWGDAHNSYLQAYYETGALGLGAFMLVLLFVALRAVRLGDSRLFAISVFLSVFAITSSSVFVPGALHAVLALCIGLSTTGLSTRRVLDRPGEGSGPRPVLEASQGGTAKD